MDTKSKLRDLVSWPPPITHLGVSLTRFFYAACILVDMVHVYLWRATSFSATAAWVPRFVLPAAIVALASFGLGLATRFSAVAVFALLEIVYGHLADTYALDRIKLLVTFVFIFAPAPRALALDVRLRKAAPAPLALVPPWFAIALLLTIELPYANSVLHKLKSVAWHQGLTFWLTVTLPHFSAGRLPKALRNQLVLRLSTYMALALEALFPLVLIRPLRRWIVLVGATLHIGIALFLPIPMFGLAIASLYLCAVDWRPIVQRLNRGAADGESASNSTSGASRLGYVLPALLAAGEAIATVPPRVLPSMAVVRPILATVGLNNYGVYLDFHFTIPKPIVRFVAHSGGRPVSIPSFDERGYPEVIGRYWCMVAIAALRWNPGEPEGDQAMSRYVGGALSRQGLTDADFVVYGRDVSIPLRMDPGLGEEIKARPWVPLATGVYEHGQARITWNPGAPLTTRGRLD